MGGVKGGLTSISYIISKGHIHKMHLPSASSMLNQDVSGVFHQPYCAPWLLWSCSRPSTLYTWLRSGSGFCFWDVMQPLDMLLLTSRYSTLQEDFPSVPLLRHTLWQKLPDFLKCSRPNVWSAAFRKIREFSPQCTSQFLCRRENMHIFALCSSQGCIVVEPRRSANRHFFYNLLSLG